MGGIPYGKLQVVFSGEFWILVTVLFLGPSNGYDAGHLSGIKKTKKKGFFRDRYDR